MSPEGMNIRTFPVHAAADCQIDGAADAPPNTQANSDRTGPTVSLWFSRRVLSWRVSITMEAAFCVEALEEEALARHGCARPPPAWWRQPKVSVA